MNVNPGVKLGLVLPLMRRSRLAQFTVKKKQSFLSLFEPNKNDDTVISLCVGRLLVSVLLAPSLTPDSLSVETGPIVLE